MTGNNPRQGDSDFEKLQNSLEVSPDIDGETRNLLENKIQAELDAKLEERFLWILLLLILIDCYFMMPAQNLSGPLVVGLVELILIWVLADKCGVDKAMPLIDKVFSIIASSSGNQKVR